MRGPSIVGTGLSPGMTGRSIAGSGPVLVMGGARIPRIGRMIAMCERSMGGIGLRMAMCRRGSMMRGPSLSVSERRLGRSGVVPVWCGPRVSRSGRGPGIVRPPGAPVRGLATSFRRLGALVQGPRVACWRTGLSFGGTGASVPPLATLVAPLATLVQAPAAPVHALGALVWGPTAPVLPLAAPVRLPGVETQPIGGACTGPAASETTCGSARSSRAPRRSQPSGGFSLRRSLATGRAGHGSPPSATPPSTPPVGRGGVYDERVSGRGRE